VVSPRGIPGAVGDPIGVQIAKVRIPLSVVVTAWAWRRVTTGLWWLLRHPRITSSVTVVVGLWWFTTTHGPLLVLSISAVTAAVLAAWRRCAPASFTRHVVHAGGGAYRRAVLYQRWWQPATTTTGLTVVLGGQELIPRLGRVHSTGYVDTVAVRMLAGQTVEQWSEAAPRLAQTFGAADCRVRTVPGRPHALLLWLLIRDPLHTVVEPFDPPATGDLVDLGALPLARGEDGTTYRLRLLGTHQLIVGATGSGKGSVLWSLLAALAPAIRDGRVAVWAIDPKGGMELAPGADLFARFTHGSTQTDGTSHELDYAQVLEDAVTVMRERQDTLRGLTRQHTPTTGAPLIVIVIDELAALTAYLSDRDAKRRVTAALSLLLSQGRAVGVAVVGAIQDPRKETLPLRDLFPTRIALRLTEPDQVTWALGHGARNRGARCDDIPESTPGVGYVAVEGVAEPVRVRFTHVTDTHIAHLAATYSPRARTSDGAEKAGTAAEFAHIVSMLKTDNDDTRFGDAA
jgi:S-DNA-T family DNA segregation ATPase FtsK/SpoIIIE